MDNRILICASGRVQVTQVLQKVKGTKNTYMVRSDNGRLTELEPKFMKTYREDWQGKTWMEL